MLLNDHLVLEFDKRVKELAVEKSCEVELGLTEVVNLGEMTYHMNFTNNEKNLILDKMFVVHMKNLLGDVSIYINNGGFTKWVSFTLNKKTPAGNRC